MQSWQQRVSTWLHVSLSQQILRHIITRQRTLPAEILSVLMRDIGIAMVAVTQMTVRMMLMAPMEKRTNSTMDGNRQAIALREHFIHFITFIMARSALLALHSTQGSHSPIL